MYHVEIDQATSKGFTALHYAVVGGHDEVVKILLEEGADPSIFL